MEDRAKAGLSLCGISAFKMTIDLFYVQGP